MPRPTPDAQMGLCSPEGAPSQAYSHQLPIEPLKPADTSPKVLLPRERERQPGFPVDRGSWLRRPSTQLTTTTNMALPTLFIKVL